MPNNELAFNNYQPAIRITLWLNIFNSLREHELKRDNAIFNDKIHLKNL